jgi:lambda family phage holin
MKLYELGAAASDVTNYILVPCVTFAIVCLRGAYYGGKKWYTVLIEALLFAIVSRVLLPVAIEFYQSFFKVSSQSAFDYAFLTCISIGFVGIETLSNALKNWINKGGEK